LTTDELRCSDASDAREEPLYGTASHVRAWLLLEQPGPWGHDALSSSRLPKDVARELRATVTAAGVRIILIRRGVRFTRKGRKCFFARTDERSPYLAELTLPRVEDLLDVDLSPLATGGPIESAAERSEPLFLVCTHGKHDACCSIRGNQVSRVACAAPEAEAWECSHIGGDRFAANVVCFPHGIYYGRVSPADVTALMEGYRSERLSLDHYRGRCCYPFALQAAEYFVRRELALTGIGDLSPTSMSQTAGGELQAQFDLVDGTTARVLIKIAETPESYRLTCGATTLRTIPRYDLESLTLA
jgi:hypothetical protein